eukprot:GSA25T00012732001.1
MSTNGVRRSTAFMGDASREDRDRSPHVEADSSQADVEPAAVSPGNEDLPAEESSPKELPAVPPPVPSSVPE